MSYSPLCSKSIKGSRSILRTIIRFQYIWNPASGKPIFQIIYHTFGICRTKFFLNRRIPSICLQLNNKYSSKFKQVRGYSLPGKITNRFHGYGVVLSDLAVCWQMEHCWTYSAISLVIPCQILGSELYVN